MSSPAVHADSAPTGPWPVAWWKGLPRARRVELALLFLVTVGAVVHQVVLANWYVEDAAISFAYARNLADGEGLVPFPGGERVEGYSNPSWVFLLAFFELLGLSAEISARGLQLVLAAATVPVVYALGREAAPRRPALVGLLSAATLAGSAQFAIWGASGLENALFNFLLAMGLWRLAVEARSGGFPWSAAWFFLVAITRPEAVLYAAVGGFTALLAHVYARRGLGPVFGWAAVFFVPFVAYHAWRWSYFAWPLPNTYYAKIGEHRDPEPLHWAGRGWRYVRNWAGAVGSGPLFPVVLLGLTGSGGARPLAAIGAALLVALTVLLTGDQRLLLPAVLVATYAFFWAAARRQGRPSPAVSLGGLAAVAFVVAAAELARAWGAESDVASPAWLDGSAPYALLAVFLLLPLTTLGRAGWVARLGCWATAGVAVFFAVYSGGDWMKSFRWMSLLTVPGSVVLACGLAALGDLGQEVLGRHAGGWRAAGWTTALLGLAGWVAPNVVHTNGFVRDTETSPYQVRHRVRYMDAVRDRLHIDERIVALDVDQGAHLWWSDYWMLDIAGLIDASMAHGRYERAFIREYLFEEKRPHFAHVHGTWASTSRIPTHPEWRRDYVEIPGYPAGRTLHVGNHVRRDLILVEAWDGADPERARTFAGDVELVGWRAPSPEVAPGRRVYLEAGFRTTVRRSDDQDFRIVAFLSDRERLVSWDLAPGYDWVPPHEWRTTEIFTGRWSLRIPDDLPPGTYDLGFALIGPTGVMPLQPDAPDPDARMAVGEVRFAGAVQVRPLDDVLAAADADHDAAIDAATTGDCEEAEHRWWLARMHLPRDRAWADARSDTTRRALAGCWVGRAEAEPLAAVPHLARARSWDHRSPRVRAAARPVADALYAEGLEARAAQRWDEAWLAFSDALRVDPQRSWARRYAEEARAHRFGYDAETRALEAAEKERRREEARQRAEERRREAAEQEREVDAKAAAVIEARGRRATTTAPTVRRQVGGRVVPGEADGEGPPEADP